MDGSVYYEGGFSTDAPETTSGTRIYDYNNITIAETGGWHHIALTDAEIAAHARTSALPNTQDASLRLLLTFDGTLKDQSQYGNDGVALLDVLLTQYDAIVPSGISSPTVGTAAGSWTIATLGGTVVASGTEGTPSPRLTPGVYVVCQGGQSRKIIVK